MSVHFNLSRIKLPRFCFAFHPCNPENLIHSTNSLIPLLTFGNQNTEKWYNLTDVPIADTLKNQFSAQLPPRLPAHMQQQASAAACLSTSFPEPAGKDKCFRNNTWVYKASLAPQLHGWLRHKRLLEEGAKPVYTRCVLEWVGEAATKSEWSCLSLVFSHVLRRDTLQLKAKAIWP